MSPVLGQISPRNDRTALRLTIWLGVALLAACGPPAGRAPGAPADGASRPAASPAIGDAAVWRPGEVARTEQYLAEPRFANADLERGRLLLLACRACHTLGPNEPDLLGPNLYRIFGRVAGSRRGFAYSEALERSDLVWTPDALLAWLERPTTFIPGNNMAFAGLGAASDRQALVAVLLKVTAPEGN